jgi:hypothetical protein
MSTSNSHHNEDALSLDEHASVEAARGAYAMLKKTFESWITVGRGLQTLWLKAERIGGRQTFGRLREKENLGERQLQKATVTRLLQIIERLPEVEHWRQTLTQKQQFEWSSPSAIFKHCPVFAKPKDGAIKPKKKTTAKETTGKLAEYAARIEELEQERDGAREGCGNLRDLQRMNGALQSEIDDLKSAREDEDQTCSFCGKTDAAHLAASHVGTARICAVCAKAALETLAAADTDAGLHEVESDLNAALAGLMITPVKRSRGRPKGAKNKTGRQHPCPIGHR